MATNEYDAIVVGARCAGSPAAMLLARNGHKVLVLDKDHFPNDTLSTHMVHPPGIALLKQWGVLERLIATGCPAIERYKFDFGPFTIAGRPQSIEGIDVGYGPRRLILDKLLVDAAAEMSEYQKKRDEHSLPMFDLTCGFASLEPPPPEMQQVLGATAASQDAQDQFVSMMAGTIPVPAFFAPENVGRIMAASARVGSA